jgi:hypothetical protein
LSLASEGRVVVVWWSEGGNGFIGSQPEGGPGRISTTSGSAGVSVGAKEAATKLRSRRMASQQISVGN